MWVPEFAVALVLTALEGRHRAHRVPRANIPLHWAQTRVATVLRALSPTSLGLRFVLLAPLGQMRRAGATFVAPAVTTLSTA